MRGFKAKALRALCKQLEPDTFGTPDYQAKAPGYKLKTLVGFGGELIPYKVSTPIRDESRGNRLYKHLKRDLSHAR